MTAHVLHKERADGVRPELQQLLDDWEQDGEFDILVAENGGVRAGPEAEATQEKFFATGLSKARSLKETPHGRCCALDCHPVGFRPNRSFADQPGMRELFVAWGRFAEKRGFVWGGRFKSFGGDGDMPHVEIQYWHKRFRFPDGAPIQNSLDQDTR